MNKLYVGNLPFSVTEDDLRDLFSKYGEIVSLNIIFDKISGRSKGFGFVEFETDDQASAAIKELNGQDFQGRPLRINEARERRRSGGGGGRFSGGRGERSRY